MLFNERKEFTYDPLIFKRYDVVTALVIHDEYVLRHSPNPPPRVFEVDRQNGQFDDLWHYAATERTQFRRDFELYCIVLREGNPNWKQTRIGMVPTQRMKFWYSQKGLEKANWFPLRGDYIYYDGYRNLITKVVIDGKLYWQQTNVWMGLVCETVIPPEGDARPAVNIGQTVPSEVSPSLPPPVLTVL